MAGTQRACSLHGRRYTIRADLLLPAWAFDGERARFERADVSVVATGAGLMLLVWWGCVASYSRLITAGVMVSSFAFTLHALLVALGADPVQTTPPAPQPPITLAWLYRYMLPSTRPGGTPPFTIRL